MALMSLVWLDPVLPHFPSRSYSWEARPKLVSFWKITSFQALTSQIQFYWFLIKCLIDCIPSIRPSMALENRMRISVLLATIYAASVIVILTKADPIALTNPPV